MAIGRIGTLPVAAGMAWLLAACSNAPDEGDVRAAVKANLASANEAIEQMAVGYADRVGSYSLEDFELLGCEKQGGDRYDCDVRMSIDTPLVPIRDKAATLRLRKTDDGWTVMEGVQ